ncbi:hypothetical protein N0V94_005977 [Neodidymelliopsis sp. IMI 364377]|nr:hypothetical protein N0V94_005977 [Neodidymelliopsis sp. IMI 364377]
MDRIYGRDQQCYVCGREPSIGFLYECRQDCSSPSLHDLLSKAEDKKCLQTKSALRFELENIGLSESVIRTAEQGYYTASQLATLKTQKKDLEQTIADSIQGSQINDVVARLTALARAPSNNDGATYSTSQDASFTCAFRACHTCRPYYRDRVYISFAAVVSADFSPMSELDMQHLPTKSANIMRSIGVYHHLSTTMNGFDETPYTSHPTITFATSTDVPHTASTTASDSSELTFKTTQTDVDELHVLRRPRKRFYNMGHKSSTEIARDLSKMPPFFTRQGLTAVLHGIFRSGRDSSSSGSMITLPVPRTGTVRDSTSAQPVGEFDIGALRRVRRQKEKNELQNGTYVGGFEDVAATAPTSSNKGAAPSPHGSDGEGSCSSDSDFSVYSCITEADADGGVALTEDAVEFHSLDVLPAELPASKSAILVRTETVKCEDDESEADVGLQSIMAQV